MSLPSVRDCLQRLDRMRDTPQLVAQSIYFTRRRKFSSVASEAIALLTERLATLHELCLHMAANLNGGVGVPPTPELKPGARRIVVQQAAAPAAAAAPSMEPGATHYTSAQAAIKLEVSLGYFYKLQDRGHVPEPSRRGRKSCWPVEVIDRIAAERKANPAKIGGDMRSGKAPS